ncbi:hypothetical protein RB195_023436 [Necator americanus]|uniref:Reverse transcriptase/retrotransposon-derived protein RNase H-like domain-containing protein n=1 Tax=Necator americanus TaxID=51031 RepID=A0ABR1ELH2_NECAM
MDALIAGLDGTADYLDDILTTDTAFDSKNVLSCRRRSPSLDSSSTPKDDTPEKITAIQKMPAAKDVSQLRSFPGLINFYGNFVKDLHNLRAPLDTLTKKDVVYTWTPECQSSFDIMKAILSSDLLLTHFDSSLPIIAAADASN